MDYKNIDFGKEQSQMLDLIIIKSLTLSLKICYNSLKALSGSSNAGTEESELSPDFPGYTWYVPTFDALILLGYPAGFLIAAGTGKNSFTGGFPCFLGVISVAYFPSLALGLARELAQITLKIRLCHKIIPIK